MKTDAQIVEQVASGDNPQQRLLLMMLEELHDFKHVFLHRNNEPYEDLCDAHDHEDH